MRTRIWAVLGVAAVLLMGAVARAEDEAKPGAGGDKPDGREVVRQRSGKGAERRAARQERRLRRTKPVSQEQEAVDSDEADLLDELDDARIRVELLELEVAADKDQIRQMPGILRSTELQKIQGFSSGPVIGGGTPEEREENIDKYKAMLEVVRRHFVETSKELARERRRVADLERRLRISPKGSGTDSGLRAVEMLLDLLREGLEDR